MLPVVPARLWEAFSYPAEQVVTVQMVPVEVAAAAVAAVVDKVVLFVPMVPAMVAAAAVAVVKVVPAVPVVPVVVLRWLCTCLIMALTQYLMIMKCF